MNSIGEISSFLHNITYDHADPRIRDRFLMGSPFKMIALIFCQFVILKTAHVFMQNRAEGFKLAKLSLVITFYIWSVNLYIFYKSSHLGWLNGYSWTCEPIDRSTSQRAMDIVKLCHFFVLFKSTYFLELLVFILRKKDKLVSFYMFFHHLTFPMLLWILMNYQPGGHITFSGFVNSLNHVTLFGAVIVCTIFPKLKGKWLNNTIVYGQVSVKYWRITTCDKFLFEYPTLRFFNSFWFSYMKLSWC